MVEENVRIHDQYQFEVKLGYTINGHPALTPYSVDTYFFIPRSLGISPITYSKKDFYRDMQTYIRFKTPVVPLQGMSSEGSPLENLRQSIAKLLTQPNKQNAQDYEYQVKMFSAIFKSAMRDHVFLIQKTRSKKEITQLVNQFIFSTTSVIGSYRKLRTTLDSPTIKSYLRAPFLFGDEYCSLLIEAHVYQVLRFLNGMKMVNKGGSSKKLHSLLEKEYGHRVKNNYKSLVKKDSSNEEFIFRKSVLKKYIMNVLFLSTRTEKEGIILEHVLFGIAAGLSMIFATGVAFFSFYKWGNFTIPFFIALVVSYMFKDRMKEVARNYFSKKVKHKLFDHKTEVYTDPRKKIGVFRESVDFIPQENIPKEILKMRDKDHITEIEDDNMGEQIILYKKKMDVISKNFRQFYHNYSIEGINDIMRFTVIKFLSKMDNPEKDLYLFEKKKVMNVKGERVYHLNVIIKFTTPTKEEYKRFRIVMNRKGIRRIEQVSSS